MLPYQIQANEQFFKQIKMVMAPNATWIWPDAMESFKLIDNKFHGSKRAYKKVGQIVSKKFLENNFVISE